MRSLRDIIARRQHPEDSAQVPDLLDLHEDYGAARGTRGSGTGDDVDESRWFEDKAPEAADAPAYVRRPPNAVPDMSASAPASAPSGGRATLNDAGSIGVPAAPAAPSQAGVDKMHRAQSKPAPRVDTSRVATQPNNRAIVEPAPAAPRPAPAPAAAPVAPKPKAAAPSEDFEVPAPQAGRSGPRAGRVKTRLLGFDQSAAGRDPMATAEPVEGNGAVRFPVGWIVVVSGPGIGTSFPLANGVSQIGRSEDQTIPLAFGDNTISRNNHAAIAYDDEDRKFFLGHGGKSNLVRLNGSPVLSTEQLSNGDRIRIGETTLQFVALCGEDFAWDLSDGETDEANSTL